MSRGGGSAGTKEREGEKKREGERAGTSGWVGGKTEWGRGRQRAEKQRCTLSVFACIYFQTSTNSKLMHTCYSLQLKVTVKWLLRMTKREKQNSWLRVHRAGVGECSSRYVGIKSTGRHRALMNSSWTLGRALVTSYTRNISLEKSQPVHSACGPLQ